MRRSPNRWLCIAGSALLGAVAALLLASFGQVISGSTLGVAAAIGGGIVLGGCAGRFGGAVAGGILGAMASAFGSVIGGTPFAMVATTALGFVLAGWLEWHEHRRPSKTTQWPHEWPLGDEGYETRCRLLTFQLATEKSL